MRHLFTFLIYIVCLYWLAGCTVNRYYYVAEEPITLYEFPSFSGQPVLTTTIGDTIATTGTKTIGLGGVIPVEYKGYRFYSPSAKARFVRVSSINPKRDAAISGLAYAARQQYEKKKQAGEYVVLEDTTDWYGQVSYATPVLGDAYAVAPTIDNLPAGTITKIRRYDGNYWQIMVNGKTGYIGAYYVSSFSKSANPFTKIVYTGRLYGTSEGQLNSTRTNTPTTGATIHTGPRGGRYYINSNGNKTYVPRSGSSTPSYRSSGSRGRH